MACVASYKVLEYPTVDIQKIYSNLNIIMWYEAEITCKGDCEEPNAVCDPPGGVPYENCLFRIIVNLRDLYDEDNYGECFQVLEDCISTASTRAEGAACLIKTITDAGPKDDCYYLKKALAETDWQARMKDYVDSQIVLMGKDFYCLCDEYEFMGGEVRADALQWRFQNHLDNRAKLRIARGKQ
jgi:hypothetical protein